MIFEKKNEKTVIRTYTNADEISTQILSSCDLALLDIDFKQKDYNGLDLARKLRLLRPDAIIIFITNSNFAPLKS